MAMGTRYRKTATQLKREAARSAADYNPPGDNPYIDNELAEKIFGENVGIIAEEGDDYTMPAEIQEVFELHGLRNRHFSVLLKHLPDGCSNSNGHYITGWHDNIPTMDWIAKNYGPGHYQLVFQWKEMIEGERDKRKTVTDTLPIDISEKYGPIYKQFQFERRIKDMQKKKEMLKDAQVDQVLDDSIEISGLSIAKKEGEKQDAKAYVSEVMEFAKSIGLTQAKGIDWAQILGLAVPLLPALFRYLDEKAQRERERQDKFMLLMMNNNQSSASQLLEALKSKNGPQSGTQMIEEFGKMIFSALDIKDALTGGKESTVDKIFGLIEKFLPAITMFATMPKQQRVLSPQFAAAQAFIGNDQAFQNVMNNPEQLIALVRKLDNHYGWEQTDRILAVMEIERPPEAIRVITQQYPSGDPRNENSAEEQEEQNPETVEAAT